MKKFLLIIWYVVCALVVLAIASVTAYYEFCKFLFFVKNS